MRALPSFKYHPDPIGTGAVVAQRARCFCCGHSVEYIYTASAYSVNEIGGKICPWCIYDGTAASRLSVEFVPSYAVLMCNIPDSIVDEVVKRTPGYHSWQEGGWIGHCNDACAYMGDATEDQCTNATDEAIDRFANSFGVARDEAYEMLMNYDGKKELGIHTFKCLHCGISFFRGEYA